jgi:hypothetical protein
MRHELLKQLSDDFSFFKNPCNAHRMFLATEGSNVVGRLAAFVNNDLKDRDGVNVGCIGFFECVNNYNVACDLLAEATTWLQGHKLSRIWGPMNFDIWHGYRFMTRGFDEIPFLGEPYNKSYYPEFFEQFGFVPKHQWDSFEVIGKKALERLMEPKQQHYDEFLRRGYRFENFNVNFLNVELEKLHSVLANSFSSFLGYTAISVEDFQHLFDGGRQAIDPRLFAFVYNHRGELVGFAGAVLEMSDAVRSMRGKNDVISKLRFTFQRRRVRRILFHLGGYVSDGWRERAGLGRAGFYHIMRRIVELGYEDVIIALMARGNKLQGMMKESDTAHHREYTLYELRQ